MTMKKIIADIMKLAFYGQLFQFMDLIILSSCNRRKARKVEVLKYKVVLAYGSIDLNRHVIAR